MAILDSEAAWALAWLATHVVGVVVMLVLRGRSYRQVLVAEHWRAHAEDSERDEADKLVILTRDRHRRNNALLLVTVGYLLLGLLVFSLTLKPWLDPRLASVLSRAILTIGEAVWIASAWLSVSVGDRIAPSHFKSEA
jgi:hypothetical protein